MPTLPGTQLVDTKCIKRKVIVFWCLLSLMASFCAEISHVLTKVVHLYIIDLTHTKNACSDKLKQRRKSVLHRAP